MVLKQQREGFILSAVDVCVSWLFLRVLLCTLLIIVNVVFTVVTFDIVVVVVIAVVVVLVIVAEVCFELFSQILNSLFPNVSQVSVA